MLSLSQIAAITSGKIVSLKKDNVINNLLTDSRKAFISEGSAFFAINGLHHDGHQFISDLYEQGLKNFIIEKEVPFFWDNKNDVNVILVDNCMAALQTIAVFHRQHFNIPVIGITGSNGKTIVKEWLSQLLSPKFNIAKSPKSYNSQLGVPLSVWQLSGQHEIGIFEAGISKVGEMERLEAIIKPSVGIFTNIGTAHDEGFESIEQKVKEKAKLFKNASVIIYCKDHPLIDKELQRQSFNNAVRISWSTKDENATVYIENLIRDTRHTGLRLRYNDIYFTLNIPFNDLASIENCMHCIVYLLYEGFSPADIQKAMNGLGHVGMRLELKLGINDCYIIDDSYNNDLAGLSIALDFQSQQKQKERRSIILSDILESGLDDATLYAKVAGIVESKGITRFIGIGKRISAYDHFFSKGSIFFEDTDQFLQNIKNIRFSHESILIKGARVFLFERIVQYLQEKIHGTVLEINLDALTHNLNFYRSKLMPQTKIMVMVKAFAYGSGSFEIANLLQYHRVDYLAVAYTDEGISLRKNGIKIPIMVMNPSVDTFDKLLEYQLEPEIYSQRILRSFLDYLQLNGKKSKVHIKLDTGMHRLGFVNKDINEVTGLLNENKHIKIASIFSHLAGADSEMFTDFSHDQALNFEKMSTQIRKGANNNALRHLVNSAGIIRFPEYHYDMVRLGIGLYGIEVNDKHQEELKCISTLKTLISQIKRIQQGESVGYGRMGVAEKDSTIATIAIGYADGYDRRFGNGKAQVMVNGKLAPTIGNICMDMTMIDITGIDAEEGDEVLIFGEALPISSLAKVAGTIPYETLTNIGERVKRVFFSE